MSEEKRSRPTNEFENLLGDLFDAEEKMAEADAELFDAAGFEELVSSGMTDKPDSGRRFSVGQRAPQRQNETSLRSVLQSKTTAQNRSAAAAQSQNASQRHNTTVSHGAQQNPSSMGHRSTAIPQNSGTVGRKDAAAQQTAARQNAAQLNSVQHQNAASYQNQTIRHTAASANGAVPANGAVSASDAAPVGTTRTIPVINPRSTAANPAAAVKPAAPTKSASLTKNAAAAKSAVSAKPEAPAKSATSERPAAPANHASPAIIAASLRPEMSAKNVSSEKTSVPAPHPVTTLHTAPASHAVPAHSAAVSAGASDAASDRAARREKRERVPLPRPVRGHGAPFITSGRPVTAIYADLLVATLPAIIWAVFLFGVRCLAVLVCSVGAAVLTELVLKLVLRRRVTVSDLSVVWSGVTVGMLMPPAVPLWVPMLASAVGIGVFKCALGGRGRAFISPALGGFAVIALLLPSRISMFTAPFSRLSVLSSAGEGASYLLSAVPGADMPSDPIGSLFLGIRPGAIGEVSALMLLIGFAYLLARGVLSWEAPLTFVGAAALLFYIFPRYSLEDRFLAAELLCGLVPICALVFAPDFACSPVFSTARLVYGALCGVLTFGLRYLGAGIYSAVYATLIAQLLARPLDSFFVPKCFGNTVGARLFHIGT